MANFMRFNFNTWQFENSTDNGLNFDQLLAKGVLAGTEANRPSAGIADRIYIATDTEVIFYDNGTTWNDISSSNPRSLTTMKDIIDLDESSLSDNQIFYVIGYNTGTDIGGGVFYYDSSRVKSDHDGGIVISPTVPWDGTLTNRDDFLNGVGETDPSGTGVFVRFNFSKVSPALWGAAYVSTTDDYTPLVKAKDACLVRDKRLYLEGQLYYGTKFLLNESAFSIIGDEYGFQQRGSTLAPSALVWIGGAEAMMEVSIGFMKFVGFSVENQGTATVWLDCISGSIGHRFIQMNWINGSNHTLFSNSVIRSQGNRLGYSVFDECLAKAPASILVNIDGQATSNTITPMSFQNRCIFESSGAAFTILKIKDEKVETVTIRECTFNHQSDNITIIDTSDTPADPPIDTLIFTANEVDIPSSAADTAERIMKLHHVRNIEMNYNRITGGGDATALVDLVDSRVTSFDGNSYESINGEFFNADSDSFVNSGMNWPDRTNSDGEVNALFTAGGVQLTYSSVMVLDCSLVDPRSNGIFRVDVTDGNGYQFRVGNFTSPQTYVRPGQVFTVCVRNTSGGAISAPSFTTGFNTGAGTTAPATGNNRSFTFYWDGSNAIEISRTSADVANS